MQFHENFRQIDFTEKNARKRINKVFLSPDAESVLKDLQSVLITLLSDPAAPLKSRAAAASALGDCAFLGKKKC